MNRSVTAVLRDEVLHANQAIPRARLATLTWGNVSGIDRAENLMVIKPSGVPYADLEPRQMVVVDLDGRRIDKILASRIPAGRRRAA